MTLGLHLLQPHSQRHPHHRSSEGAGFFMPAGHRTGLRDHMDDHARIAFQPEIK